jgi:hypothetical protein
MGLWQIGESGTALALDAQGRGEVTFTVTDASTSADRAVLTVNPLDGADDGWFTVTEPTRPVAAGASVVFPVGVTVPPSVAAGTYGVQGVAYSADTDPSETSATSKRVSVTVGTPAPPPRKRLPWWVFAIIGAAVLLVVTVLAVLLLGGDGASTSTGTTTTTAGAGSGSTVGGGVVRTIPRDILVPRATTTTAPPPELITVIPTLGLPRSAAIEILDGDFEVVVDVDCSRPPFPVADPPVFEQEPLTGRHPEGSEVTLVVPPVPGDSACL